VLAAQHDRLRVTFLDVAQGDATLVQAPDGRSLLVDAGGATGARFDVGERVVTPALWHLGVRRLDVLVITHADPDHIGGAPAIVRDLRPRAIWEGIPVPRSLALQQLAGEAKARAIEWRRLQAGDATRWGDVDITTRHPPLADWERQHVRNHDSVVLDVQFGDVSVLLTGDIGRDAERDLASRLTSAAIRILKVPHHGSATSSSPPFIAAARPALAVVSAGKDNLFGHPSPDVLVRYRAAGVPVLRTDEEGAIMLSTDGRSVDVTTWAGRSMTLGSGPKQD
jgi:competence protein ComEC